MTQAEIYDLVKANSGKAFIVTYTTGKREQKRLFICTHNYVCEFGRRSRTKGYVLYLGDIVKVELKPEKSEIDICRDNLTKVVKYLSASGMWSPMLKGAEYLLSLTDEELLSMKDYDNYRRKMEPLREQGVWWWGSECFHNLFYIKIRTMRSNKWLKDYHIKQIKSALAEKRNYQDRWRDGYDNSFEIRHDKECVRGWYSEEYKDCGNGHYYFLLDETHIIFAEND